MKRRTFLQWLSTSQVGLALAALGMTDTLLWRLSDRYHQVLASPTPRKLALLVGINQYVRPTSGIGSSYESLQGCVTDVELQRELLIHRFGFLPEDILTVTDLQATYQGIVDAFTHHLIQQAKPGDVVVFHFSGYGRQVNLSADPSNNSLTQNSLIPVDGLVPKSEGLKDLLEETLLLLLRSLPTHHITTILDTSYSLRRLSEANPEEVTQAGLQPLAKAAFLRLRNCTNLSNGQPISSELALQDSLLEQLHLSRSQLSSARLNGQIPGAVLAATGDRPVQPADLNNTVLAPSNNVFEAKWSGFSAGLFTYALTQYLWNAVPTANLQVSFSQASSMVQQLVGHVQQPTLVGQKSQKPLPFASHLPPNSQLGGEGVMIAVETDGKSGKLWLAGLPAIVLEYYGSNSVFQLAPILAEETTTIPAPQSGSSDTSPEIDPEKSDFARDRPSAAQPPQVQLYGRDGLIAKVRLMESADSGRSNLNLTLKLGQPLYELIRVLPRDIGLLVALDPGLERIERVDAISTLAAVPYVRPVIGDQPVDCLFGRLQVPVVMEEVVPTPESQDSSPIVAPIATPDSNDHTIEAVASKPTLSDSGRLPPHSRYGLFSLGQELLANTVGPKDEAIKLAIHRIIPHLHTLLATKLLRLTANEGSSGLKVRASLEIIAPDPQILAQKETWRSGRGSLSGSNSSTANVSKSNTPLAGVSQIPIGSRIRYQIENLDDRPLYLMLFGLDSNGSFLTLYSGQKLITGASTNKSILKQISISAGETLSLPDANNAVEWMIREPKGLAEVHLIICSQPFERTLAVLESTLPTIGKSQRLGSLANPVEVVRALLQDLHQASIAGNTSVPLPADGLALNMKTWSTLSFLYQIV